MLGAPIVAALGCGSSTPPPAGQLLAPDFRSGHRLRDGGVETADAAPHRNRVVVVGGGIAGLATAWRLQHGGVSDVVVLEMEQHVGGTAHSGRSDLIAYPWGAHYVPVPAKENVGLVALFDEMGILERIEADGTPIVAEQFLCRDPQERVFQDGQWYEGLYPRVGADAEDLRQLEAFRRKIRELAAAKGADGRRPFTIPTAGCSSDALFRDLDQQSMARWLEEQGLTSERLQWYVEYACRDDYGATLEQTSAWAGLFYFAARILEDHADSQPFITWPEGNGRIVQHLATVLGDRLQTGLMATSVADDGQGAVIDAVRCRTGEPLQFKADYAVFAGPQFVARHVIEEPGPPRRGTGFSYGSWMVANVHLSDRPKSTGFPLSWDNVIYNSPSLGYVVATHQKGLDYGPTVLTYYYPFCDADPAERRELMLAMDWQEWSDVILTDLEQAHPDIRGLTKRIDIMRWGHAMVRPVPGFLFSEARQTAGRPVGRIHFANTDLSGIALMEEAWYHGLRAGEEILSAEQIAFRSLIT